MKLRAVFQKTEIARRIKSKWPEPRICPLCQSRNLKFCDRVVKLTEEASESSITAHTVTCKDCGYIMLFEVPLAGVIIRDTTVEDL